MQSYDTFARFYDPVQGDRADHAAYMRWLIEKHHPTARTAIELACGTGSILVQLQPDFEVTGVDLSGPMLAVAAEKVPEARLVQADMTEVHIGEAFDVVLCLLRLRQSPAGVLSVGGALRPGPRASFRSRDLRLRHQHGLPAR